MTIFEFVTINENLGTRQLGEKVRELLLRLIAENEKVVLDFTGVNVVSNSFADECLAKLLFTMPLEELKQRTTFRGLNEFARKNIAIAFRRRLNAMNLDAC
ncbi:MAG: STAS-like domain-containing protein [Parabacteroides sp.]|nr:STAS-like domain-containing protein [Parabacteroides sp.]